MRLIVILISLLSISCQNTDEKFIKHFKLIKSANINLLRGISIKARYTRKNKFSAIGFTKKINDKSYFLINFNYYSCSQGDTICIKKKTKKYNYNSYLNFCEQNNISKDSCMIYVSDFTKKVIREYERLKVYKIVSLNDNIIEFKLNSSDYIIFVKNRNHITNEYWKNRIKESKLIEPNWYLFQLSK